MTEKRNLRTENPAYTETKAARIKGRTLYGGTAEVKKDIENYLFRAGTEKQSYYEVRANRAALDPYVEKIIIARHALMFAKSHTRELGPTLKQYEGDVDLMGTPADVFFYEVSIAAEIDGICCVLVDMPPNPNVTEQPEENPKPPPITADYRPFFQQVPAGCVLDWEIGEDGKLLWVVIEETAGDSYRVPGFAATAITQWKVWDRNDWTIYRLKDGAKEESPEYYIVGQGSNDLGVVPLIPFYGVKYTDFAGWPAANSVLDHIIQLFNKESDLDWFEMLSGHPIPYTIGPEKLEKIDAGSGFHLKSTPNGEKVECGYLEPGGGAFKSIRDSILDLRFRILSIALAQARKDTAQVQSDKSQREDRRIFAASLKTASRSREQSEEQCWNLMAQWLPKTSKTPKKKVVEISYNRDFDDRMIEAQMINALRDLTINELLPTEALLQLLIDGEILPPDFDIQKAMRMIQADVAMRGGVDTGHPGNEEANE